MNILFIGNSYTQNNRMPYILKELAEGKGHSVDVSVIARGGESFEGHYHSRETHEFISKGQWDLAVLQEQSTRPVEDPDKMIRSATRLHNKIGNIRTLLYLTWAREHAPEMQSLINESYFDLAKLLDAQIVPVGLVWEEFLKDKKPISLFDEDGHHPTLLGSYAIACTFYAIIFDESPMGLSNQFTHSDGISYVIDKKTADFIQYTVWGRCQSFAKQTWS